MKKSFIILFLFSFLISQAQEATSVKAVLLKQLKSTHTEKDWFVPVKIALEGLTPEQVSWKDGSGNHSIGQLASHLVFWNERQLNNLLGLKNADFSGNNEETFEVFNQKNWNETEKKLDAVLTGLEKAIQAADETKLKEWYGTIANISTHNAYHTGQIIFVRKLQGSWNPEKGVK